MNPKYKHIKQIEYPVIQNPHNIIPGFGYYKDFINDEESNRICEHINNQGFKKEIQRRQQHYGITYYHTRHDLPKIQPQINNMKTSSLEIGYFDFLIERLLNMNIFQENHPPNQCLVNEYKGNQTISPHIEDKKAFGQIIAGVSLLQPTYFQLQKIYEEEKIKKEKVNIFLEKNSLYVLKGEARNQWTHGIKPHFKFVYNNQMYVKDQNYCRISLTFRHVLVEGTKKPLYGISNFKNKLLKEQQKQNLDIHLK